MQRVTRNKDYLNVLAKSKKKLRDSIIQKANKDLIYTICECVLNFLNGNLHISSYKIEKLRPYKCALRKLIKKSKLSDKKKILIQKGGFLNILIPSVISALSSIITSAIKE
jgi:hypothetical protein